jgi:NAD(P)-dependent dehydrogenase (short-subunit alcohol dehydrogenase family)
MKVFLYGRWLMLLLLLQPVVSSLAISAQDTPNVIIVGGSSGMGKAAALAVIMKGGKALLVSRSPEKLERAKQELVARVPNAHVETASLDITKEEEVEDFASKLGKNQWDGLVVTAAGRAVHGPVATLPTTETRNLLESKLWGAYHCAKHIGVQLNEGGAVVFCAGVLNRRPGLNCAPLAMANGALEGLTRSLALEWGPRLRVNCLSPGFCDTERFDHMDVDRKHRMLENTAASLPLQKVGQPSDMGQAIYYLLTAPFCTGVILDVDGGHGIRQYANPDNDPMRQNKQ